MQRKSRHYFQYALFITLFTSLALSTAQAAKALWTFAPQTPTQFSIMKGETAQVVYLVTNNTSTSKNLVMKPITGITQTEPCKAPAQKTCTLKLSVDGSALTGNVQGGPVLCKLANQIKCQGPSPANSLNITLLDQPTVQRFTITPSADVNGTITPQDPQVVDAGTNLSFAANPKASFGVNEWLLDGAVVQSGGTSFQLNNIQANHTVEVTFNQATLSPLTQNLTLSIKSSVSDLPLAGNPRIIRIENTGTVPAVNLQVSPTTFPVGTSITNNTCTGTLNAGATCDITITPGSTASANASAVACTTAPGSLPVPTVVTVSADNASPTDINVLLLGQGCIYQGGYVFAVDDTTPNTGSIGGKVAALTDEPYSLYQWAVLYDDTTANNLLDGLANTNALATPVGQYPAAQSCLNKVDQGFADWYLPAICELGRFVGINTNAGCGLSRANLYTSLHLKSLGGFAGVTYWSSTEYSGNMFYSAWAQFFGYGDQYYDGKNLGRQVRCIRAINP
ncbi:InlB B-repeat-containing protein [Legionella worsleiensis]|uniref:NHL repeat protein n=1 Tax=Legionella worsleiensis TaxID=45076 RepID=A0A0W1ALF6_9GAMM|nr:DUF1566 domain-containing protein [Legionella worsleiensis]KTD82114.1 NHL repeat protein [Legionella worsleiensis]STY31439.1 NHL repeat protein [Legionella worsleiensis]